MLSCGRISGSKQKQSNIWQDLALKLKDHPAIVGYNILNEPHPEIAYHKYSFWDRSLMEWYETIQGGVGDLNLFYDGVVKAIRSVDHVTPNYCGIRFVCHAMGI